MCVFTCRIIRDCVSSTGPLPALDILPQPFSKDDEEDEDDDDVEDPLAHVHDMIADDDDDADADGEDAEEGEGREEHTQSAEADLEQSSAAGGEEQRAHRTAIRPLENMAAIEPERHLSKKELKRQELEELDSILAEFGIDATDRNENGTDKVA